MRTKAGKAPQKASRVDGMRAERERQFNERQAQAKEARARMAKEGQPETDAERAERLHKAVRDHSKTFQACLSALLEIKADQLYLKWAPTFEAYCGKFLGLTARHANRMLTAGTVQEEMARSDIDVPPTAAAELAKAPAADRVEVMREAARDGKPTVAKVKAAVKRRAAGARASAPDGKPASEIPPIKVYLRALRQVVATVEDADPKAVRKYATEDERAEFERTGRALAKWFKGYGL